MVMMAVAAEGLCDYHSGGSDPEPVNQRILAGQAHPPVAGV